MPKDGAIFFTWLADPRSEKLYLYRSYREKVLPKEKEDVDVPRRSLKQANQAQADPQLKVAAELEAEGDFEKYAEQLGSWVRDVYYRYTKIKTSQEASLRDLKKLLELEPNPDVEWLMGWRMNHKHLQFNDPAIKEKVRNDLSQKAELIDSLPATIDEFKMSVQDAIKRNALLPRT